MPSEDSTSPMISRASSVTSSSMAAYITAEATTNDLTSLAFLISASVIALFCAGSLYTLWHTPRRARSAPAGAAGPAECTSANARPV
ncbi:hypothetical protein ACFXAY_20560 [Streptomyces microflavus]|uniref:hypothetical protein n=1 Tax=Streptomyces microflavus TaxID=1919 RepID=UPI0036C640B7